MTVLNDGRSNYEVRVWVRIKRLSDYFQSFSLFNYLIFPHSCLFIYFRNIFFRKVMYLCRQIKIFSSNKYLNSATVSINRLSDSKLSLWCLGALFDCCISRDKPFHPLTPPSDLRQYAVENRQEIRISQSLY